MIRIAVENKSCSPSNKGVRFYKRIDSSKSALDKLLLSFFTALDPFHNLNCTLVKRDQGTIQVYFSTNTSNIASLNAPTRSVMGPSKMVPKLTARQTYSFCSGR